jgi:DEAD/DEAH box helicase domain-containing protein
MSLAETAVGEPMQNLSLDFTGGKGKVLVLDVETQYLSSEVPGGWDAVDKLRVALVVTWDATHGMRVWYEEDVPRLLAEAEHYQPVVTFNGEGFDFKVLSAYGPVKSLYGRSTDLLSLISRRLGFRVKLDSLAHSTLGKQKTGSGIESVEWWRSGDPAQRQKVVDYCKMDVEITRDIYFFGKEKGYVFIDDSKLGRRRRVEISW